MQQYRLFIGNPGAGKSTLANCIAKRVLFKSGISFGSGKTKKLDKTEHEGIEYLDTPGLADINIRQSAATAITKALKQSGLYQIFFVVVLSAGRFRPEDVTTILLVLLNIPSITFVNIIINKISKGQYESLQNEDGMVESNLLRPLEMMGMRTKCKLFFLLYDQMLADADDTFEHYPDLDEFVNDATWVHIDSCFVNDIPGDEKSFTKQLDSVRDKIINLSANQLSMPVRFFLFSDYYFFNNFLAKHRTFEVYISILNSIIQQIFVCSPISTFSETTVLFRYK